MRTLMITFILMILSACSSSPQLQALKPNAVILAYGDSLTYGTGAISERSYPVILQSYIHHTVINAGQSGDRVTATKVRLKEALEKNHPDLVLLCIGGNDLVKRTPIAEIKKNLAELIQLIKQSGAQLVLIAVPYPRITFDVPEFYFELSKEFQIPLESKLLPALLANREYKSDLLHLNANGYQVLAIGIADFLKKMGAIP